jgi:hypothetical protein
MARRGETKPAIARVWRGRTSCDRADEYLRYWREEEASTPLRRRPWPSRCCARTAAARPSS